MPLNPRMPLCWEMTWSFEIMLFVCLFCVQRYTEVPLANPVRGGSFSSRCDEGHQFMFCLFECFVNKDLLESRDTLRYLSWARMLIYVLFDWMFVNKDLFKSRDTSHKGFKHPLSIEEEMVHWMSSLPFVSEAHGGLLARSSLGYRI